MSWPSKILPFRKLVRAIVADALPGADEFPRFHKEQARPPLMGGPVVAGFGVPPLSAK